MLTAIIEAVGNRLQTTYRLPADYLFNSSREGGAYFFVNLKEILDKPSLNKNFYRKITLEIQYHPKAEEDIKEVWKVADSILNELEWVEVADQNTIRGGDLRCEFTDNRLHAFVTYNIFLAKETERRIEMQELKQQIQEVR